MAKQTIDIPAGKRCQGAEDLISSVLSKVRDTQTLEYESAEDGSYRLVITGAPEKDDKVANPGGKKVKEPPVS